LSKQFSSRLVTEEGIVTVVKPSQFLKQLFGKLVTEGIVILVIAEFSKQLVPKLVIVVGIVKLVNVVQFKKQELPKLVTPLGIERLVILEQPSKQLLPTKVKAGESVTVCSWLQSLKVPSFNIETLFKKVTSVNAEQPVKVSTPKLVTEGGIVEDVNKRQSLKQ
jgi:hypothetical protein